MTEFNSVHDAFAHAVRRWPQAGAVAAPPAPGRSYHPDGLELTYADLAGQVAEARDAYASSGFSAGHRVALLIGNRPEFFTHYLALNSLGVSIVPVNPDYRHDELTYLIAHSEAVAIITEAARRADIEAAAAEAGTKAIIVDFEAFPASLSAVQPLDAGPPDRDSECALLYTSGTTGRPKGCILTNEYFLTAGAWYRDMGGMATFKDGARLYNPLPLFHMNALAICATAMFLTGGCLISPDRFHPRAWWRDVNATRATIIHYLGVVAPMLLNLPPDPLETQHEIRFGVGAGIEPNLHALFEQRYGFPLIEVWGMTETGRILHNSVEPRLIDTRAFGRSMPGLEARVVDENDLEVPDGTEGELVVRHSADDPRKGFFAGYLKDDEATAEAWRGGWFHSGDTVTRDSGGLIHFVDRKKNIIRRSGENIAASEVEACIQAIDAVQQVAVLALPDPVREEEVLACIVPMPGTEPDAPLAEAIFAHAFSRLAYFKAPGWIVFRSQIPTTGTQKIQKQKIFADGEDPTALPDSHDFRHRKKRQSAG